MTSDHARKIIQFTLTDPIGDLLWAIFTNIRYTLPRHFMMPTRRRVKLESRCWTFSDYGQNFHKYSLCFLSWTHSKLRLYWPVRTSESPDLTNPNVSKIVADHYLSWGHLYLTTNCPQLPNVPQILQNPGSQSSLNLKYIRHFIFIVTIFLLALRLENSNRFERPYIKMI